MPDCLAKGACCPASEPDGENPGSPARASWAEEDERALAGETSGAGGRGYAKKPAPLGPARGC